MPIGGQLCNPARITRIVRYSHHDEEDDEYPVSDEDRMSRRMTTMMMITMMITDRCPWQHSFPRLVTRNSKVRPDYDNDDKYDDYVGLDIECFELYRKYSNISKV